ncbi:MAG: hypothetical protein ACREJ8_11195 [Candidatus Methylomirabilales bacterium]
MVEEEEHSGLVEDQVVLWGAGTTGEALPQFLDERFSLGRAEILSVFGPPYRVESKGDQEVLTYFYGKQSHWTILLYSESRHSADILNVYLNQNGIVSNYAFSEGVAMPERDFPTRPLVLGH